ncbi:zinc-binding alcohol dehydrogenase [Geodermatophilus sp. YIM 151500]|uniref:zinc-dependent alcohol dehydrogenase n=1 Tax=Geodermatophilus sp. YIM 151500 TaxID=2984531 RepID=UPI0021E4A310|nr:zinc-binding alcohol dehydrogenase [Geodermatophilus sp. YIM 151500]MCV2489422.1 zinc-binding alcohol dehydrogenase [Geodermatophilus sp. YIM 151500]
MSATVRTLVVPRPGVLEVEEGDEPPLAAGRFRAHTLFTGLSAGTELTWYRGTNPYLSAGWDADLGLFDRDRPAQGYPVRRLGYMEVARVTDSRTPAVTEGGLVAMAYGHTTVHHGDPLAAHVVPLPDGLDPRLGVYVAHLGPICVNGVLHAAADAGGGRLADGVAGRLVAVTGGGPIGLLVGMLARVHGAAEVVVLDPTERRRAAAVALGLQADEDTPDAVRALKARWRHGPADHGADVVFQCRGQAAALATALRALRPQGTVVDLAFYTGGADVVAFGEEFHHNGLTVRCAQIGRVPRGLAHLWDRRRLSHETVALLADHGAGVLAHLLTDVVPFDEAPGLFADLSARRRHLISAAFALPPP